MSKKLFKAMCGALAATMLLTACAGGGSSSGGASTHALDSNCNVSFRSGRRNDNKSQGACGIVTIRARQAAVDVGATAKMSGKPG